jgi:hypothetical protein
MRKTSLASIKRIGSIMMINARVESVNDGIDDIFGYNRCHHNDDYNKNNTNNNADSINSGPDTRLSLMSIDIAQQQWLSIAATIHTCNDSNPPRMFDFGAWIHMQPFSEYMIYTSSYVYILSLAWLCTHGVDTACASEV